MRDCNRGDDRGPGFVRALCVSRIPDQGFRGSRSIDHGPFGGLWGDVALGMAWGWVLCDSVNGPTERVFKAVALSMRYCFNVHCLHTLHSYPPYILAAFPSALNYQFCFLLFQFEN